MLLTIDQITVAERQRDGLDQTHVGNLKESIRTKGLLHAPVVLPLAPDGNGEVRFQLVCGLHRLTAMQKLHEAKIGFSHDGTQPAVGLFPVTNLLDLGAADLLEAELEENIIRLEMSWQDRSRALAAIHERRRSENPTHSVSATAKELMAKGEPRNERNVRREVRNATILAQNLHRPSVAKARNATEAMGILYKEEEAKLEAAFIERRKQREILAPSPCTATLGDMRTILPQLPATSFDLIIADLPYGIGADSGGFRQRTVEHHNYSDTPDVAKSLIQTVVSEGFRVAKLRANLFVFGDIDLFPYFKAAAQNMGWKPFRTPIVWQKSESEGLAPWGREGFRRTYELIFFATKGQKGLRLSPTDVITIRRVGRADRRYGPEKPIELLKLLIECSTVPGDSILDPCCGAGSTLAAARQLNRKALGIELDVAAHALAVVAADHDTDEPPAESAPPATTEELLS